MDEWMAQLADEYKNNETLKKLGGFTPLAKEYLTLKEQFEKNGGFKPFRIPTEEDPPETRAEFLKALGVPEKEDEYDINPFDVETDVKLDDVYSSLRKAAKGADLTKAQAKKVSEWHVNALKQYLDRANETVQNQVKATDETLRKEWGAKYDETKEKIGRLLKDFPEDKMSLVREKGLANDPVFISILGHIAQKTGEPVFVTGGHGAPQRPTGIKYKDMDKYKST